MRMSATLSPCGRYRYTLSRVWNDSLPKVMFIGLNPSTADDKEDDPTIAKCIRFAKNWGFGSLTMMNLFAFRATDPDVMKAAEDPVGSANDDVLLSVAFNADLIVAAWGVHGTHLGRSAEVKAMFPELHYIKLTKAGHPGHPLYLKENLKPTLWQ